MSASITTKESTTAGTVFIKMALSAWDTYNERVNKLINSLSDEKIIDETAPVRNSGN